MSDKDDGKMDKDLKDIDDMKDKYYKPELHVVPDVDIPQEDVDDSPLNRLGEGDTISVSLDSDVIIQKLSHDIYSSWKSGLRELYNNEGRACRITSTQHLTAVPQIHITIDPVERRLTIEGIDSQGITVEVFDKSLRVLGVSSNFDSKEIGQMGMGFAGYTMIFEAMILDSYSREDNEKWSVLADGGINFKVLGNPIMKSYGTRLSGTYKNNIDPDSERDLLINIMKQSNKIWKIRNKVKNGEWDSLEMLEMYETIEDYLAQGQKINAIKYYRQEMSVPFGEQIRLREAKEFVDDIQNDMKRKKII